MQRHHFLPIWKLFEFHLLCHPRAELEADKTAKKIPRRRRKRKRGEEGNEPTDWSVVSCLDTGTLWATNGINPDGLPRPTQKVLSKEGHVAGLEGGVDPRLSHSDQDADSSLWE